MAGGFGEKTRAAKINSTALRPAHLFSVLQAAIIQDAIAAERVREPSNLDTEDELDELVTKVRIA